MPAAATSTNRTAAHLRNMGHSSENGRTGAERHPLYARPAHSDCWPLLVCRHLPDEERRLGGLGEPPAGSSVTAVSSNARPGGTSRAAVRRPSLAVLNTPRLTGFPLAMAHNWYVRPAGAGGRSKTAMTTRCRDGFQ